MMKSYRRKPLEVKAVELTADYLRKMAGKKETYVLDGNEYEVRYGTKEVSIDMPGGSVLAKEGEYIVTGIKGEMYPCNKDIFEELNAEVKDTFSFGQAIEFLKEGRKVARKGWNGKGMWIVMMPALFLEAGMVNGRTRKHIGEDKPLDSQPYIAMWTAEGKWQPGWLASQADLMAEDWTLVE